MKNLILIVLFAIVIPSLNAQNDYDPLRYLVVFKKDTPKSQIDEIMEEHQATEIWVSPFSEVRYWESSGYPHYVGNDFIGNVKEEVERLKNRPVVTGGGLEYQVITFGEFATGGGGLVTCYQSFRPASQASINNTLVSILDTGLSPNGLYPPAYTFSYGNYSGYNYVDGNGELGDENGHGTHVAGIVSHVSQHLSFGNSTQASSIHFDIRKVFNSQGVSSVSDIVYGFDEAVLQGAKVINMSFAYYAERPEYKLDPLEHSIIEAAEEEVLVICAAGNEFINNDTAHLPAFPASYTCDNILSVGSADCASALSEFSNYGTASVDVAYLGEYIPGPSPTGELVEKTGTSQAAAVVSGVAAAASSYLTSPDYKKVKCAILNTVETNQSLNAYILSSGIVDPERAATIQALNSCATISSHEREASKLQENKIEEKVDWSISPNPFEQETMIKIESSKNAEYKIQIMNLGGEVILSRNYQCKIGTNSILLDDVSQLTKGTYFISLNSGKIREFQKFIKL